MPPGKRRHTGRITRYTPELAEWICRRLEAGASLNAICRDTALPCREAVLGWRRRIPAFRERYDLARERQAVARIAQGKPSVLGGGQTRYTDAVARTICERLASGESLLTICADRRMPAYNTVLNWLRRMPDFRAAYNMARTDQAHALADEVLQTVRREDLPPADKQARIKGLAWYAGKVAPKRYGERAEGEEAADEGPLIHITVKNGGFEGTE